VGHEPRDDPGFVRLQVPGDLVERELTAELRLEPLEQPECPRPTEV
jgi:hypothetical protein